MRALPWLGFVLCGIAIRLKQVYLALHWQIAEVMRSNALPDGMLGQVDALWRLGLLLSITAIAIIPKSARIRFHNIRLSKPMPLALRASGSKVDPPEPSWRRRIPIV